MENESGRKWELRWRERGGSTPREQAADQVWRAEGGEQLAEGKWGDTGAPWCRWPPMLATTGAQLHQLGYGSQLRVIARKHNLSLKLWYWTNKAEERTPSPRHRHRLQKNDWYHWSGETTLIARMPNWLWWITTGDLYLFHFIAFSH